MSIDTLMERLRTASTLDWRATRDEVHELHKQATTSQERGALLAIYTAVMDQVERSGTITDIEKFREARLSDYRLFLITEASDGQHIVPERMLTVTEREIAAGRMKETDELHRLARVGILALPPASPPSSSPSPPSSSSWWSKVQSLFGRRA